MIDKIPHYQAHRGYCLDGAQENTLESFIEAKKKKFLMCEMDVQLSKDTVPIVFHDKNLIRMGGEDVDVADLTAQQMKEKVHSPTLEEVIAHSEMTPYLNIELKTSAVIDETLEFKVSQLIKKYKVQSRVLISSFNPLSLARMRYLLPNVQRALLVTQANDPENHFYLKKMWFLRLADPHFLNLDCRDIEYSTIYENQKNNLSVMAWTVNDRSMAQKLLDRGAVSIITDTLVPL